MDAIMTMSFDSINKSFQLSDGSIVTCHINDTAGQERFRALGFKYYINADAVLLVYDISKKSSFEDIKNYYIPQIKDKCKKDIIILLLGNKSDKENERQVSIDEGISLASQEKYEFKETSCLHNINVAGAFEYLVEKWNYLNQKKQRNSFKRTNTSQGDIKQKKINRTNSVQNINEEPKNTNNIVLSAEKTTAPPKKSGCCS